jgi:hypothetical protein
LHTKFTEQGYGRVEVLLGALPLAGRSVAFSKPEVTLSRQRAEIELLGPSKGVEKICLALIKERGVVRSKLGKKPERVSLVAPLTLFDGKKQRLSAASLGVGHAGAAKIGFAEANQNHGMATQAMHRARLTFGFLQQGNRLVDAIGQTIGVS